VEGVLLNITRHSRGKTFMHIVLIEPEIPPNTGNVARLCAATRTTLHLIEPFGFKLDDAQLKRAGMDYWRQVTWKRWSNWRAFVGTLPGTARLWFIEAHGPRHYAEVTYQADDYLIFGRETAGLPGQLLEENRERWLRIPMFNPEARSLNLSNCAALVLYEALRQQQFAGEILG
jgi:tRNA (cytidine/uridine-2'-O-)-methyltransferase